MKLGYIEKRKGKYSVLTNYVDVGPFGLSPCFSKGFDTIEEAEKHWEERKPESMGMKILRGNRKA